VIHNSSVLAFVPLASTAVYSATMAAIHSYALSQRFMLAGSGVRVVEIAPPWVDSSLRARSVDVYSWLSRLAKRESTWNLLFLDIAYLLLHFCRG
jgi:short-subunit dehydrogenase involved in D-alanine esterification of teichoic acids